MLAVDLKNILFLTIDILLKIKQMNKIDSELLFLKFYLCFLPNSCFVSFLLRLLIVLELPSKLIYTVGFL